MENTDSEELKMAKKIKGFLASGITFLFFAVLISLIGLVWGEVDLWLKIILTEGIIFGFSLVIYCALREVIKDEEIKTVLWRLGN